MEEPEVPKRRTTSGWWIMFLAIFVGLFGWFFAVFGAGNFVIGKALLILFLVAPMLFIYGLVAVLRGKRVDLDK